MTPRMDLFMGGLGLDHMGADNGGGISLARPLDRIMKTAVRRQVSVSFLARGESAP